MFLTLLDGRGRRRRRKAAPNHQEERCVANGYFKENGGNKTVGSGRIASPHFESPKPSQVWRPCFCSLESPCGLVSSVYFSRFPSCLAPPSHSICTTMNLSARSLSYIAGGGGRGEIGLFLDIGHSFYNFMRERSVCAIW